MTHSTLPVAIIGAGPVGLAAAAHLAERRQAFVVLERGAQVAAGVSTWAHVQLFSPWRYGIDSAAQRLLTQTGWNAPDPDVYPTGGELRDRYLLPLAHTPELAPFIRLNSRVTSISRQALDKMKALNREDSPFVITYADSQGVEHELLARAVIDASGGQPNPLGANGTPALGERSASSRIFYGIPDVLGKDRARYAGRRVLVIGSGHSAFNVILDLLKLNATHPETQILWGIRRETMGQMFGGGVGDELARRGQLGLQAQQATESGRLHLMTGFRIQRLTLASNGIDVETTQHPCIQVDQIVSATGFRPDLDLTRELRLALHEGTEGVAAIAPLIDPNFHSCGSVPPHGATELAHPEPNFYTVGLKSYGRAPTFLMMTGYEQVRSVVAALAGDWEAARRVELVLPETGVCSPNRGGAGASCCGDLDPTSCCDTDGNCIVSVDQITVS